MASFSVFNMDALKQANLIKGGYPARYGGRVSSVLDIVNKEGNRNRFEGDLHLGLVSSKASFQGPIGKGSWFLAGRRTYYDYVLGQSKAYPGYYFYDLNGKITQQLTARDKLTVQFFRGNDTMGTESGLPKQIRRHTQRWGNRLVSSRWSHQFNGRLWGDFMLYYSQYQTKQNRYNETLSGAGVLIGENGEIYGYDWEVLGTDDSEKITLADYTLKSSLHYHLNNAHTEHFGIELKQLQFNYTGSSDFFSYSEQSPKEFRHQLQAQFNLLSLQASVYWQDDWQVTQRLQLKNGLRFSYYTNQYKLWVLPRIALRYKVTEKITLNGAWGRYVQFTSQLKMVEENDNARITMENVRIFGNFKFFLPAYGSVQPTEAYHYILGIESFLNPGIQVSMEGYYKQIYGIPEWKTEGAAQDKSILRRVSNLNRSSLNSLIESGNGRAYGLEFLVRKPAGVLTGWLSYTFSRTLLQYQSINEGNFFPAMYDRTHDFSAVAQYDRGRKWSLSFGWYYATGQPYTLYKKERNSLRLKDYSRLDIGVYRTYNFRRWQLKTYLQIFNAYNRKNIWGKVFLINDEDEVVLEKDVCTLPIIPSFGFQVSF